MPIAPARSDGSAPAAARGVAFAARGLEKRYGAKRALAGVDLDVGEGEIVGLLGPNGAGKSTLTKIACGLVRATSGSASVAGHPAGTRPARAVIGYLAELFRFPGWSSADEVLELHQRLARSRGGASERSRLLELVGLADAREVRVEAMSKGMQQRLGIAQALVGEPRLLLLDEPTSALDPIGRRIVRRLLEDLRGRGVAVLLNSHLLSEVELVSDRVYILSHGKVVAAGPPHDLARPRGVEIDTASGTIRREAASRDDVARLVREVVERGEQVYAVRPLASTLEDAYVEAIGDEPAS
ncbi:MAG: ABC transporter ATP-binding protein [Thermoleophilaceae bacterium]